MTLVTADGIFESPRPELAFSKAMDYKEKLATSYSQAKEILKQYLSELPDEERKFFEEYAGLYDGKPKSDSENSPYSTFEIVQSIANMEKEKGLLRKLIN